MASRVPGGRALGFAEARPMHRTPHSPTHACHHITHCTTPQRTHTNTPSALGKEEDKEDWPPKVHNLDSDSEGGMSIVFAMG
jgi:hypothetical protein